MIYAEILAGGSGNRMGNTEKPKQFLMLGDKPIIIHTIEQFVINPNIDRVLVCCPEEWMHYTEDLLRQYDIDGAAVAIIRGGENRHESLLNGCRFIAQDAGIGDEDIVLTHDAVRPYVTQRIIEDNIRAMERYDAVNTVIPATDTILYSEDGSVISDVPARDKCFQAQTPQTFKLSKLMQVCESLSQNEKNTLTDACSAFTIKGLKVGLVNGEASNIKITTPYDLEIATAILTGSRS